MPKHFAVLLFSLFFSFSFIFAEDFTVVSESETSLTLKEIDQLINNENYRDYQNALLELNRYAELHPEQFDNVQKRINKIMKSRNLYTAFASELLRIIKSGQEGHNQELKDLTDKLLALERNPKDSRLDVIKDMNYLMNMYQYSAIQNKTAELVQNKMWTQASQKACEGFIPLRENFQTKYRGDDLINQVQIHQDKITALAGQLNVLTSNLEAACKQYKTYVLENNEIASEQQCSKLEGIFKNYSLLRNQLIVEAEYFNQLSKKYGGEESKKQISDDEQDLYLSHADEYFSLCADCVLGWRNNYDFRHGLLGVYDSLYFECLEDLKTCTSRAINQNFIDFCQNSSVQVFKQNETMPDNQNLKKVLVFSPCAKTINGLYSLLKETSLHPVKSFPNYDISVQYAYNISENIISLVEKVIQIAGYCKSGLSLTAPESAYPKNNQKNAYQNMLVSYGSQIKEVIGAVNNNLNRDKTWGYQYLNAKTENQDDSIIKWDNIEKTLDEYVGAIEEYAEDSIVKLYIVLAQWYEANALTFVSSAKEKCEKVTLFNTGTEDNNYRKFPDLAVKEGDSLNSYINECKEILLDAQKILNTKYSGKYQKSVDSLSLYIKELDSIKLENNSQLANSRKLVKDANNYKKKADESLAEAKKALKNNNFDRANEYATRANEYYNQSLSFNYNEEFSKSSSGEVLSVLNEIGEKRKMIISDEVDSLIVQANSEFANNNYKKAQNLLFQAQERWNIVFSDIPNQEITSLSEVVKISLSMNTGREVLPGDPLYKEVSNILNSANQLYNKALNLSKKEKTEEANENFNASLLKLEELRSIVPFNKDANLLRLKIQQIQNPKEFEIRFRERIENAKEEYKQKDKQLQAYNDLSDLLAIQPDYPGLSKLIEEIEYEMGKKKRPVQVSADKQQAITLTAQANRLYNSAGNDQEKLKQALSIVGQALVKDSSNKEARRLQSQIRSKIKVKAKISSFELNERYNEALEKFNNGDYYGANEIINSLWNDSDNRTEKLERLKKRVEARL